MHKKSRPDGNKRSGCNRMAEKIKIDIIREMKSQIMFLVGGVLAVILGIYLFNYEGKPEIPIVDTNGEIDGVYAIEGIMRLGKPYTCTFEKSDETSKIVGVIHTDSVSIYGQFRIRTDLMEDEFNTFLVVKNNEAYIWTSLQDVGYKAPVAKSASKNASPLEQAQIVGTRDKLPYKCKPWTEVDNSIFEAPSWLVFPGARG